MWSSGGLPGSIRNALNWNYGNTYVTDGIIDPHRAPGVDEKCLKRTAGKPIHDEAYIDLVRIADTTNGITEMEKKAINDFREFIDERKKIQDEDLK